MNAKHHDTRSHLLSEGRDAIAHKGFTALGLAELLRLANVPKGSFYHYFKSKEHFGCVVIEQYIADYLETLETLIAPDNGTVSEQLMTYFQHWTDVQTGLKLDDQTSPEARCLVVKLSAEIADLSTEMREALHQGTSELISRMAKIIEEGFRDGSVTSRQTAMELAESLYEVWLGASLLEKLRRDGSSLQTALRLSQYLLQ